MRTQIQWFGSYYYFVIVVVISLGLSSFASSEPLWSQVCQEEHHPSFSLPFCDTTLSLQDRIDDYINRIPTEQKIAMMGNHARGYDPLGIPPYQWWSEGLHGPLEPCVTWQNRTNCPTSFPCPSGLGNAFNTTLYHAVGTAIGIEGRAISELRIHDSSIGDGLTYWSPNVNLQRDPRWGRNQEVPGEDPVLTSLYGRNFVQGLQHGDSREDQDDDRIQVAACCKHFVANSLEHWKGHSRHDFNALISHEDLHNYYLVPFQECVEAGVAGIMCSYNAINGEPACTNKELLQTTLRQSWNFDGYIVTDCGALRDTITGHGTATDVVDSSSQAIQASVDINCGDVFQNGLLEAYQRDSVTATAVEETFQRLAKLQFQLGLFDPKNHHHPGQALDAVGSHHSLALDAALQSIVLLKNDIGMLPFDKDQKMALIGPHIHGRQVFMSNYFGDVCARQQDHPNEKNYDCVQTPVEAMTKLSSHSVLAVEGCHVADSNLNNIDKAVELAVDADRVVLLVGLDNGQEREEKDRTETILPGLQQELVHAILDVAADKTILVLVHGGSLSLGKEIIAKSSAILSASYGGQMASQAIASVLFGNYNPTGKLAATMYPPSYVDEIPLTEMGLNVGIGRTYMYYSGQPEFSFGHGLSYSKWSVEWTTAPSASKDARTRLLSLDISQSSSVTASVRVTNLGPMPGSQSILLFWRPMNEAAGPSVRQKLANFLGTPLLAVGESHVLTFDIGPTTFALWDSSSDTMSAKAGLYQIEARVSNAIATKLVELAETGWPDDSANKKF